MLLFVSAGLGLYRGMCIIVICIISIRTYSYDSSESEGSESDGESDTEEEMLSQLSSVSKANASLQVRKLIATF